MRTVAKVVGVLVVLGLIAVIGAYTWASASANRVLSRTFEVHRVDFPVPFPLSPEEVAEAGLTPEDAQRVARERAIERGRHLISARYACTECHGANLGGGVMVDAFPIGSLLGPNLTGGAGSRTVSYTPADWDRIVRHGVLPDGRPAVMPSEDFRLMSDQELSDIITYITSLPPVDNQVPAPRFGPLGRLLLATGQMHPSATMIEHDVAHPALPPAEGPTAEFGAHLAATCTGCHGANLAGGPITGGDPSWPPAANLTPDPSGLASWSYEDFVTAMREGRRPDGTTLRPPMVAIMPYAQNMTDTELRAIWAYLRSLPPVAAPAAD